MQKKISIDFAGFLQATALIIYLIFVDIFMTKMGTRIGNNESFAGPIVFLLFFIISAVTTATIVLGKSGILFWEKKFKEAFTLLGWTIFWCLIYFGIFIYSVFR